MAYNRNKAKFYGDIIWDKPEIAYDPRYSQNYSNYQDIRADKNAILDDLDRLSQTALGLSLLNKAINADSLRFVGLSDADADT